MADEHQHLPRGDAVGRHDAGIINSIHLCVLGRLGFSHVPHASSFSHVPHASSITFFCSVG